MPDWLIEPLAPTHDRTAFSCGKPPLDDFIQSRVTQYDKRKLGKTFVATRPTNPKVLGYYTLAAGAVAFQSIPPQPARKLPRHPIPVVLLARLAVDQSTQGHRLGETLLLDALQRALTLSKSLGIHAIEVHALDNPAAHFYQKYGFIPLLDNPLHLYLPIITIQDILK